MKFSGKIADPDGKVILPSVQGQYQIGADGKWKGSFILPSGDKLKPSSSYTLITDRGRSVDILVKRIDSASQAPFEVFFTGSGPPP